MNGDGTRGLGTVRRSGVCIPDNMDKENRNARCTKQISPLICAKAKGALVVESVAVTVPALCTDVGVQVVTAMVCFREVV